MKKWSVVFSLLVATLSSPQAEEANIQPRFERVREIEGSFAVGAHGRIRVPGDVFGQARNFPADLRILASDGTQWPFFLHVPKETDETRTLLPEIRNGSFVAGQEPYLQFDLVIARVDGKPPVHNQMELTTSGHDFVRRVEIFTGHPDRSVGRMAAGYLIDFSRQRNAKNRSIRYPASDAGRLHVRIYSNAPSADEPFKLSSARLHYRAVKKGERELVDFVTLAGPSREQEANALTQLFDVGEAGRPVEFMTFEVENTSYARCVSIFGRNTDHESWRWVGGGEIHALAGDEETTIKLRAKDRFLKVQVFHYDDQPLTIQSIQLEAVPRYLVFEAVTPGRAGLYFRAWDINVPRYDLKGRLDEEKGAAFPLFQMSPAQPNQMAKAQPWRNDSKGLGGLAVAAVSLLVIGIIVRMLKQQKEEG